MRCQACRRPLTNPASIKHQLGPDCLRRAVKAGTAPIEALAELAEWKRSKKRRQAAAAEQQPMRDALTMDLFDQLRAAARDDLTKAIAACESLGIRINLMSIEE